MDLGIGVFVGIAAVIILTALLARSRSKDDTQSRRGALPGLGYRTIFTIYDSGGSGGGHSTQYRVPKDPQDYAKAMMPKSKGNAK